MIYSRANWIALFAVGTCCLFFTAHPSRAEIIAPPTIAFTSNDGVNPLATWNQVGKAWDEDVSTYNGSTTKSGTKYAWNITADPDPFVSSNYAITNNTLTKNNYSVTITLPIIAIPGATVTGGSVQGGVTDNNGDGATLGQSGALPIYMSLIDGKNWQPLLPPGPTSLTVGSFLSGTLGPASFGLPIPSLPGPAALTSIGIRLDFSLTPGDSATFSSVFVVNPIPEPTTMALGSMGFALVVGGACYRRRRLRSNH